MRPQAFWFTECMQLANTTNSTLYKLRLKRGDEHIRFLCSFKTDNRLLTAIIGMITGISAVATILNCVVLYLFNKRRIKNKIPNILLAHQSFVDLVNSAVYSPVLVAWGCNLYRLYDEEVVLNPVIGDLSWFEVMDYALPAFLFLSIFSSMKSFLLTAIERFISVRKPLHHRVYVTQRRIKQAIALVWLLTLFMVAIYAFLKSFSERRHVQLYNGFTTVLMFLIFVMVTVLMAYTFFIARAAVRTQRVHVVAAGAAYNNTGSYGHHSSAAGTSLRAESEAFHIMKLFSAIYICFLVGFLLLLVARAQAYLFHNGINENSSKFVTISILCFVLSSALNPMFTISMMQDFRLVGYIPAYSRANSTNSQNPGGKGSWSSWSRANSTSERPKGSWSSSWSRDNSTRSTGDLPIESPQVENGHGVINTSIQHSNGQKAHV